MTVPIMQGRLLGSSYKIVMICSMGGWLITSILLSPEWFLKVNSLFLLSCGIVLFYVLMAFMGYGNISSRLVMLAAPYFTFFVFYFYYYTGRTKVLGILGLLIFIGFTITFITTLIGMIENPYAYREIKDIEKIIEDNYSKNIGTVHHVYASVIFGSLIASLLQGKCIKNKFVQFLSFVMVILCFYLGITCSSGIVVVLSFVAIALILVQNRSTATKIFLAMCCIIVFVLLRDNISGFLKDISASIDNQYISLKIKDLGESLSSGSSTGELAARTDRWMDDLNVCLSTFGIGIGPYYEGAGNGTYVVAEHSQLFADMARYGIAFLIYIASFFGMFFKLINKMLADAGLKCNFLTVYLIFIIMYVCQPVFTNFVLPTVILFVLPASIQAVKLLNGDFSK